MVEFNHKGVIFQGEFEMDSDDHSVILINIFHKGECLTECLSDSIFLEFEVSLNEHFVLADKQGEFECRG